MTPTADILASREKANWGAQITLRILLALDGYMGIAWIAGDPNRTQLGIFIPARKFIHSVSPDVWDPARIWGLLLLILAAAAAVAMTVGKSELTTRLLVAAIAGYWTFWVVLDVVAAFAVHGSLTAWAAAAFLVVGHARACIGVPLLTRRAARGI